MTDRAPNGGGPVRGPRLLLWLVLALGLALGVALYFRYGTRVAPLHGTVR